MKAKETPVRGPSRLCSGPLFLDKRQGVRHPGSMPWIGSGESELGWQVSNSLVYFTQNSGDEAVIKTGG